MTGKRSGKVGLGNVISLAGLALLGFFTFMGALLLTAGNVGGAAGIALATVVVLSLILAAAVYCKKVDTDFSKWKTIEIISVVLFLAAAVFPARYVMHFFDVLSNKKELQENAMSDAAAIRNMFKTYEDGERSALSVTTTGLQNAFGEEYDMNVKDYFMSASIRRYDDIDSWMLNERRMLLGDTGGEGISPYTTYKANVDSLLRGWTESVKSWNLLEVGRQAKVPGELAPSVVRELNKRSEAGKLPVINFNSENGIYQIDKANQKVELKAPELKFEKSITSGSPINVVNIIIYIAIIALIMVRYFLTPRSDKTEIGGGQTIVNMEGVNRL